MRNLLLTLSYDGKNYHGWQIQKNAHTVQAELQKALYRLIDEKFDIKGCSRTDTGVHANMYCLSMKIPCHCKIACKNFPMAINRFLPKDIAVYDCNEVPLDFHARYSCIGKEYIYKIWNNPIRNPFFEGYALHYWHPLNIKTLNTAAQSFCGTHDFTSFCTLDARKPGNFRRTVKKFEISEQNKLIIIRVEADGFLYNMVRIMVGTLLRIAEGKISEDGIKNIILARDRSKAGNTARACGLYLDKVYY
ncbi:MAG: tRNA pseudouridine(38-40) synthase TruA [Oscillospiraceae bacterium]|jgi:tRNA pseudouridine38-40 synthase|nr:tRNA pseudouridine(38-40) synthase TruA [Oscillospiraceae bacterium]